jgi:hypothetical protein
VAVHAAASPNDAGSFPFSCTFLRTSVGVSTCRTPKSASEASKMMELPGRSHGMFQW